jgi:hypothetical protein
VFTGCWRLGVASGAAILGEDPDIACYAKLLTAGEGGRRALCVRACTHHTMETSMRMSTHLSFMNGQSKEENNELDRDLGSPGFTRTPELGRRGGRAEGMADCMRAERACNCGVACRRPQQTLRRPAPRHRHPSTGVAPLAVTLAREEVFAAFEGQDKVRAAQPQTCPLAYSSGQEPAVMG